MKAVSKGVERVRGTGQRNFKIGPKTWRRISAMTALLSGLVFQHAEAIASESFQRNYRRLLNAVARGDLNAADQIADDLSLDLVAENLPHAGMNFQNAWEDIIKPQLWKEYLKQQESKNDDES